MGSPVYQVRNSQLVDLLSGELQPRYEPNFAWGQASGFLLASQLRGHWNMASVDNAGAVYDQTGQGRTLTNNNTVTFGLQTLFPHATFNATNSEYLSRADEAGLDITGNLWLGCWVFFDTPGERAEYIMAKWGAAGSRSYALLIQADGTLRFQISDDGTASATVDSTTVMSSNWYFVWGMYDSQTEYIYCGIDAAWWSSDSNMAVIFNSNAPFTIGSDGTPGNYLDGSVTLATLCADVQTDVQTSAVSWGQIRNMYEQTRANYIK